MTPLSDKYVKQILMHEIEINEIITKWIFFQLAERLNK
jgi:hypothetical protein